MPAPKSNQTEEERRAKRREIERRYRERNREKTLEGNRRRNKVYLELHKDRLRDEKNARTKEWKAQNKDRVRAYQQEYFRKRKERDLSFRIACNLRARISKALVRGTKVGSAVTELGCSMELFQEHISAQFREGMSWDNYGKWELDHIQPLAKFDLTDPLQFAAAAHFSNYQPLWAKENASKGARSL